MKTRNALGHKQSDIGIKCSRDCNLYQDSKSIFPSSCSSELHSPLHRIGLSFVLDPYCGSCQSVGDISGQPGPEVSMLVSGIDRAALQYFAGKSDLFLRLHETIILNS